MSEQKLIKYLEDKILTLQSDIDVWRPSHEREQLKEAIKSNEAMIYAYQDILDRINKEAEIRFTEKINQPDGIDVLFRGLEG